MGSMRTPPPSRARPSSGRARTAFPAGAGPRRTSTPRIAGLKMNPCGLHDLRRTLSTRLHEAGVASRGGNLLAHVGHKAGVAGTYNRARYHHQKREALDLWSEMVTGSSRTDSNDRTVRTAVTSRSRGAPCLPAGRHNAETGSARVNDGNGEALDVGVDRYSATNRQDPAAGSTALRQVSPLVAKLRPCTGSQNRAAIPAPSEPWTKRWDDLVPLARHVLRLA